MSTEKKLTAVEWLVIEIEKLTGLKIQDEDIIEQAKELEKQQIIDSWIHAETRKPKEMKHINNAETYYEQTFKN